jgi:diguanylate cyclase (GGDEF)-like protein
VKNRVGQPITQTMARAPASPFSRFSVLSLALMLLLAWLLTADGHHAARVPVVAGLVAFWLGHFLVVRGVVRALQREQREGRRRARIDALTGLPNRAVLTEELGAAIDAGEAALLLVDVDRFREVNETLGHGKGDELLRRVADRLRAMAGRADVVACLGGDEFAILRRGTVDAAEVGDIGAMLARALRTPVDLGSTTVAVDASVGIALAPVHAADAMNLLRRAETALYEAKRRRAGVEVYDLRLDPHRRGRPELVAELARAIQQRELVVAFQPKVDLRSGETAGVEALVRWEHPARGLLSPGEFIPAAEITSLIRPLTLYVLEQALVAQTAWAGDGFAVPVAVNLAGPSVMDVELPAAVAALLAEHLTEPASLTLEISEGTIMSDEAGALGVLGGLRDLGVSLSLDDFGTGQTSLGQLRQLPLDEVKLDRSFVEDPALVGIMVELGHRFGLTVVAEGVETSETASALTAAGCDVAQGYLYAKPMWADDVGRWLADRDRGDRLSRSPAASTMDGDAAKGLSGRSAGAR